MTDLNALVDMYIDVWNEPDDAARRAKVEKVFADQAKHVTRSGKSVGHDEIYASITDAHAQGTGAGEQKLRSVRAVTNHRGAVRVNWDMTNADGEWMAAGFDCMILSSDGRVNVDHQFAA
ncbi:hypothetical protein GCM10011492_43120 [Flexivirga endophytica]|uniref:Nuclear transport factor 2 family protein n=1 Tax=Flexivirga endophytica TaxID=1849103 RepID=A0A916X1K8_9MICO|nr:hypothetical protein [Flexivirga endophytica]GGB47345.1 hypothetical protein GCM10011492_43120 [Flexivirga endophytica]GHB67188.1 hypothetical protein GCM10008112_40050 [Flexivirga endophytica]